MLEGYDGFNIKKDIRWRLRNVKLETFKLYCGIFNYDKVIASEECIKQIAEITNILPEQLWLIFLKKENAGIYSKKCLFITDGSNNGYDSRGMDCLSMEQFAIDIETVAEVPDFLLSSINRESFVKTLVRYIKGFKERGWSIFLNIRNSLLEELLPYENVGILHENENVCAENGKPGFLVIMDDNNERYKSVYSKYKNTERIECYWLIYFLREWINELLLDAYKRKLDLLEVHMLLANCAWGFDHFLGGTRKITSSMIEDRQKWSVHSVSQNPEQYMDFLCDMFACDEKMAVELYKEVSKIPFPVELVPGLSRHMDAAGQYLNVIGGFRRTEGSPERFENTIWMFGGCVIFGYAIEDDKTIASYLQYAISKKYGNKWRVVNIGLWGGNFDKSYLRMETLPFRKGDIVVVCHAMGNVLQIRGGNDVDISIALKENGNPKVKFWDRIVHCNHVGYRMMAQKLLEDMDQLVVKNSWHEAGEKPCFLPKSTITVCSNELKQYISEIYEAAKENFTANALNGAIVMNCNPFTLGHLYLIEKAAEQVDFLFVFVVEEDKSVFPFKDRIDLVKKGVSHIKNVCVYRSGKWMISASTFPEYFIKDTPEAVSVDPSFDVEIFARIIAPALGITVRFVGEEPFDVVTKQYNERMKEILPNYEIKLVEISRKQINGKENIPISASLVRKYLEQKDFQNIKELVPETTYSYLRDNFA